MQRCDTIWTGARLATMRGGKLALVENGWIAARGGTIVALGGADDTCDFEPGRTHHLDGRLVTPGLIDCHTHLIFAGDRSAEHEARRGGKSYEAIARAGGGILSTVEATRAASEEQLVAEALPRLDALIAEGVTTVEIKSGYGLDLENEAKMLRAAKRLADERPVAVRTTFLGAHTVPAELRGDPEAYVDLLVEKMIPAIAAKGLADAVDAFCETIGFSPAQVERIFAAAAAHGLPVKLHAEQLSDQKGAALAAAHGALSADHLEHLDGEGIAAMAQVGTVAVLLPGAFYFMRETQKPPLDALRAAGVPLALATDCNPGTSPLTSLPLAMNMGAVLFGLSVEECLAGTTIHAARALGMADMVGSLEPGKRCDLAIWDVGTPEQLVGRMGARPLHQRILGGA